VKNLGLAYCLGIEFSQETGGIFLNQKGYINDLLERFGMSQSNLVGTPMELGTKLRKSEEASLEHTNLPYQELVGSLIYIVYTRPDIDIQSASSVNTIIAITQAIGQSPNEYYAKRIVEP